MMRIDTAGSKAEFPVWVADAPPHQDLFPTPTYKITNADNGIVFTFTAGEQHWLGSATNGGANVAPGPEIPGQSDDLVPALQMQDGSFVGGVSVEGVPYMVAFDQTGNVRWSVPNEEPQMATADGGVIGRSGIIYDQNGGTTGQSNLYTQSWVGNAYQIGSVEQVWLDYLGAALAHGWWPFHGANPSGNGTPVEQPWFAQLKNCKHDHIACPGPSEAILSALSVLQTFISSCPDSTCKTLVYDKFAGSIISKSNFLNFLSATHGFYDGPRSYAPQNVAFCPRGIFYDCGFPQDPVWKFFQPNSRNDYTIPDAASQTPVNQGKGPQIYFNPATGICDVLSIANPQAGDMGVLNQSVLFHEGLHGYTGRFDTSLIPPFGLELVFDQPPISERHLLLGESPDLSLGDRS